MSNGIYKTGANITPTIDTDRDMYGATGFKAAYINKATGDTTAVAGDFTEIMLTVAAATANVSTSANIGERVIVVDDASVFEDGQVLKNGNGDFYYILNISGNSIEIKRPLTANVAVDDVLTLVGNTGLYSNTFSIANPGEFNIVISNPSVNMQNIILPISVKDETIDDIQTKLDNIATEIGIATAEVRFRAYA